MTSNAAREMADQVLAGGGEMGALMRSIDWGKTAVGPVESWPQSLRTAISILLSTKFPMYIAWGPSFTQFYNDGYRPILGSTKHPAAMGLGTPTTFAEIWEIIGPMFADVMQGNCVYVTDFMLPLDRHGFAEECYFIFSYSPIRDETGGVGGVLVTVTETTKRVLGERRLQTLRDLAEGGTEATSVDEACALAVRVLEKNAADIPFALLYAFDRTGMIARLAASSVPQSDTPVAAPQEIVLDDTSAVWPLQPALQHRDILLVEDVASRVGEIKGSSWPEPVTRALVLPVSVAGDEHPFGALVLGISPRLIFDDDYRGFFKLIADRTGSAVASARTLEDERRRAEALAELDRAKTTFFSNVSHEFRTPLTLMLGPIEAALDNAGALEGDTLRIVHRSARRLHRLVNSLLDFSRIEAGRVHARYEPTTLGGFTRDLASNFRSVIESAGLAFSVECDDLPAPAFVDRRMWETIVLNLVSNAFKFTFEGGIAVALRADSEHAVLTVRDTGIGISAEDLPKLFTRFTRIEGARSRTHEGTGIGLALVQELVRMHGGRITVTSEPGCGTTFTVAIPLGQSHLAAAQVRESPSEALPINAGVFVDEAMAWLSGPMGLALATGEVTGEHVASRHLPGSARIVLADDNADMRDYLKRLLVQEGFTVEAFADGQTALEAVRATRPDLVLTDVMMPGLDGFGLLRAIREDASTRATPVIMLSARAGEEARVEGLLQGADDYLVKPFSARELRARVRAYVELSHLRRTADQSQKRLLTQFDQAPAAICVVRGPNHVFEFVNQYYLNLIGNRDVIGKEAREAFPEGEGQGYFELLDEVYRTGIPHRGVEAPADLRSGPDNQLRREYVNFVFQPLRGANDAIEGIMVHAIDVTPQVVARQALEQSEAALQESNRRKDQFLAMLAHELRNPLAPIRNTIELLKVMARDSAIQPQIDVLQRQTENLTRIVDDLLDVARITRGLVTLKRERVDLNAIAARAVQSVRALSDKKGHRLSLTTSNVPLIVVGDDVRLEQVIVNLLTNSAKYTDPGGTITVTVHDQDGYAAVTVRDNGIGIAPDVLPYVFDLFAQAEHGLARSLGGLGVGLTVVRDLVRMHAGLVEARSDGVGRGAEFSVRLPLAPADAATESALPYGEDKPTQSPRTLSVLVVDDNADAADSLTALLRLWHHDVRPAYDARQAYALVAEEKPDVVLLDIGLPEESGYDVCRNWRSDPEMRSAVIVALTGYGQTEDRERTTEAGFDFHLVKPVAPDALRMLLAKVQRGERSRQPA